jgi:hypothetical protein
LRDSAVIPVGQELLAFSTDSFVVRQRPGHERRTADVPQRRIHRGGRIFH